MSTNGQARRSLRDHPLGGVGEGRRGFAAKRQIIPRKGTFRSASDFRTRSNTDRTRRVGGSSCSLGSPFRPWETIGGARFAATCNICLAGLGWRASPRKHERSRSAVRSGSENVQRKSFTRVVPFSRRRNTPSYSPPVASARSPRGQLGRRREGSGAWVSMSCPLLIHNRQNRISRTIFTPSQFQEKGLRRLKGPSRCRSPAAVALRRGLAAHPAKSPKFSANEPADWISGRDSPGLSRRPRVCACADGRGGAGLGARPSAPGSAGRPGWRRRR